MVSTYGNVTRHQVSTSHQGSLNLPGSGRLSDEARATLKEITADAAPTSLAEVPEGWTMRRLTIYPRLLSDAELEPTAVQVARRWTARVKPALRV
jgi:hypothetical protein